MREKMLAIADRLECRAGDLLVFGSHDNKDAVIAETLQYIALDIRLELTTEPPNERRKADSG